MVTPMSAPAAPPPPPPAKGSPWEKPQSAFILATIGGMTILLVGLFVLLFIAPSNSYGTIYFGESNLVLGAWQTAAGAAVVGLAVLLYQQPDRHVVYGVLILGFAVLSLLSTGGFLIGFAISLAGGIAAIIWNPGVPTFAGTWTYPGWTGYPGTYSASGSYPYRACLKCGHLHAYDARFCARCGAAMV